MPPQKKILTLRWGHAFQSIAKLDRPTSQTHHLREAGDEIVIHLSGDSVYRTSLASPRYDKRFDETIQDELIARLDEAVTNQE